MEQPQLAASTSGDSKQTVFMGIIAKKSSSLADIFNQMCKVFNKLFAEKYELIIEAENSSSLASSAQTNSSVLLKDEQKKLQSFALFFINMIRKAIIKLKMLPSTILFDKAIKYFIIDILLKIIHKGELCNLDQSNLNFIDSLISEYLKMHSHYYPSCEQMGKRCITFQEIAECCKCEGCWENLLLIYMRYLNETYYMEVKGQVGKSDMVEINQIVLGSYLEEIFPEMLKLATEIGSSSFYSCVTINIASFFYKTANAIADLSFYSSQDQNQKITNFELTEQMRGLTLNSVSNYFLF